MERPSRRLRAAAIAASTALLLVVFGFVRGAGVDARGGPTVLLVAWWVSPMGVYWATCKTRIGAIVIGALFFAAVAAFVSALYRGTGSTEAIGFATIPVLLWLGVLVSLAVENLIARQFAKHS